MCLLPSCGVSENGMNPARGWQSKYTAIESACAPIASCRTRPLVDGGGERRRGAISQAPRTATAAL